MGAEPYDYTVPFEPDIQAVLDKLRQQVFESGQYNGADLNPMTPDEALVMAGEDGTGSILDISRISETPDFCCAAPFTADELQDYFGTDKPTRQMLADSDDFWEDLDRGMARYVILYEGDVPNEIYFAGYSFD